MKHIFNIFFAMLLLTVAAPRVQAQTISKKLPDAPAQATPWTKQDLMEPATLAQVITHTNPKNNPLILNIGFVNNIKGAVKIGAASTEEGMKALESYLKNVPMDKQIVIYCGCCPFAKCPNVRPAFAYLKEKGYKNFKLLDLSTNLKTDWIGKGYPMAE